MQSICLILSNRPDVDEGDARCTLIVAPVSVIANWKTQLAAFVDEGELEVAIYHGNKRESILKQVKKNDLDVVITSYETIVSDLQQYEQMLEEKEELKAEKKKAASKKKKKQAAKKKAKRAKRESRDDSDESDSDDDWSPR